MKGVKGFQKGHIGYKRHKYPDYVVKQAMANNMNAEVISVYNDLGGTQGFLTWAKAHPDKFYADLVTKLITTSLKQENINPGSTSITIIDNYDKNTQINQNNDGNRLLTENKTNEELVKKDEIAI